MHRYHNLFAVLRMAPGRRIWIYDQVKPPLQRRNQRDIVVYVDRARGHDVKTRALETQWEAEGGRGVFEALVQLIDQVVDVTVTSVRDVAVGQVRGLPAHHPLQLEVKEFLTEVFPAGPGAITSLPYLEQVTACEVIVGQVQGPYHPLMVRLGLADKVAYLAEKVVEYRDAVNRVPEPLQFAEVREMRDRGHTYMLDIVGMIGGRYYDSDNAEHVAAREELLAPFYVQHDQVRASRRLRRDDPAELPGDAAPGDEAGQVTEPAE